MKIDDVTYRQAVEKLDYKRAVGELTQQELIDALAILADMAQGGHMTPKIGGSGYTTQQVVMDRQTAAQVVPRVGTAIDTGVSALLGNLSRLTRVSLQPSDVEQDVTLSEDEIVVRLKPKNRYARLVFEEVKELYTTEELNKG